MQLLEFLNSNENFNDILKRLVVLTKYDWEETKTLKEEDINNAN